MTAATPDLTEFTAAFAELLLAEADRRATLLPNGQVRYDEPHGEVATLSDEQVKALRPALADESEVSE